MNIYINRQSQITRRAYAVWQKARLAKFLAGIIALFFVFGLLNLFQFQVKNFFYLISEPFEKKLWKAGNSASDFLTPFLNVKNLENENENLRAKNQKLLQDISVLQDKQKQYQALSGASINFSEDNFNLILADIIGLYLNSDIILINKGLNDGISDGMPVVSWQKILFGKILKAYNNFSEVMLISNKNNILDVKIQQSDVAKLPVYGVVKGKGEFNIYLDLVLANADIKEGDVLLTSAMDGIFPKDLLVGKIIRLYKNDQKPFQQAEVQPFFDIKKAERLFVISDYKRE